MRFWGNTQSRRISDALVLVGTEVGAALHGGGKRTTVEAVSKKGEQEKQCCGNFCA